MPIQVIYLNVDISFLHPIPMPPPRTPHLSAARDVPLEALRGLAALMVVAWHFLLGLFPEGLVDPAYGLAG
ncbi:MAG: hypothetical protein AB7H77_10740, partial [Bdellovibrionales bacterium]